jgi:antitoxin Phd
MKTVTATQCRTRFGKCIKTVLRQPLSIEKTGKAVAVLISRAEYDRLVTIENAYWLKRGQVAEATGYTGSINSTDIQIEQ